MLRPATKSSKVSLPALRLSKPAKRRSPQSPYMKRTGSGKKSRKVVLSRASLEEERLDRSVKRAARYLISSGETE